MFAIVIFFVACNIPRTVLNFQEFAVIAPSYWSHYNNLFFNGSPATSKETMSALPLCYSPPFWAHILGIVSNLFLTLNASICCFVYCVMCRIFRNELSKKLHNVITTVRKLCHSIWKNCTGYSHVFNVYEFVYNKYIKLIHHNIIGRELFYQRHLSSIFL